MAEMELVDIYYKGILGNDEIDTSKFNFMKEGFKGLGSYVGRNISGDERGARVGEFIGESIHFGLGSYVNIKGMISLGGKN